MLLHSKIIGKGYPLLILHGLLGMGDNWISLARRYGQEGFEVHLIDLRNHGKSFHSDEMTYEAMSDDLLYYIQHYNLKDINLMGHSMGGKAAMNFVLTFQDLTKRLVVVDIAPKYYPPHHHFIFKAIEQLDLNQIENRKEAESILLQTIDSKPIVQFILKNLTRRQDKGFAWKPNIEVLKQSLDDLGASLPPLSVASIPALFVKGARSPYIIKDDYPIIKAHFPNSEIVSILNSGHWVHSQSPDVFFNKTLSFLTKA